MGRNRAGLSTLGFTSHGLELRAAVLAGVLAALALSPVPAVAATGDLDQKAGAAGCIREVESEDQRPPDPLCTDAMGFSEPLEIAVSPDGRNAYAVGSAPGSVAIFDRNPTTGALTRLAGTAGCVSETGSSNLFEEELRPCQDGRLLAFAASVTVSPDGKNVYVASYYGVAIFDRNTATGALTQKPGPLGCISQDGTDGEGTPGQCGTGRAVLGANSVSVSPDGKNVYVASRDSNAVVVFDRDTTTGVLVQKPLLAGCISETGSDGACADGKALLNAGSLMVSPDGRNVYVTAGGDVFFPGSNAVAIFDRDTTTGVLTQKQGIAGCISDDGSGGDCADGRALNLTTDDVFVPSRSVAVSPDGRNVYVSSMGSDAVAVFDRSTTTGALTQKPGPEGCVSEDESGGAPCARGRQLSDPSGVAVSPDGENVYVSTRAAAAGGDSAEPISGSAVVIFDRDRLTGTLVQKPGTAGCIADDTLAPANRSTCAVGHGLRGATSVTVSPDGKNVYTSADASDALAIFDRELPPDADNDGVIDAVDRCPNQPGPASNQGCPITGTGSTPRGGGPYTQPSAPFADCPTTTANLIRGTAANDRINGTPRADRIFAGTGNDTVDGLAADDCIDLGPGTDRGQGGDGADLIVGGLGADRMSGNLGNDRLRGGAAADRLIGGFGNDRLHGQSGSDRINAERGRDRVNGGSSNDVISAGSSGDRVAGDQGNDRINGNSGNDSLKGNSGRDRITGGSGSDRISSGSGNDRVSARDGRRDRINCGPGRDRVVADRADRVARNCEKVIRRR